MMVMMDPDQNLFPQQQALVFLSVSIDNIMSFNVNVGVISHDTRNLRGEGGGYSSKSSTIVM